MGDSWDSHGRLPGAPPASAGPRNISQAYGQQAEGSFPDPDSGAQSASECRGVLSRPPNGGRSNSPRPTVPHRVCHEPGV